MWQKLQIRVYTSTLWAGNFVSLSDAGGKVSLAPYLTQAFSSGDMSKYFNAAFSMAMALGAMIAVARIAYAGFLYMSSDIWGNKQKAKDILWDTMFGLFLLLGVYLILKQINPKLLDLNILQNVDRTPSAQTYTPPPGVDDRITPQRQIPDRTPCTIPGFTEPGIMQDGTCRFAP